MRLQLLSRFDFGDLQIEGTPIAKGRGETEKLWGRPLLLEELRYAMEEGN